MPCWTVQKCSVDLANANAGCLKRSMAKQGWSVSSGTGNAFRFSKGGVTGHYDGKKLHFEGTRSVDTNAIKKGYGEEVVAMKAEQYRQKGWRVIKEGKKTKLIRPEGLVVNG